MTSLACIVSVYKQCMHAILEKVLELSTLLSSVQADSRLSFHVEQISNLVYAHFRLEMII